MTTRGDGAPGSGGGVDTADADEAARRARRKRMRAAVRDRMVALRMTQRDLGRRAGLSESSVARLLSGERQPTVDTLERVAAALGVPVAALLAPDRLAAEASSAALTTETLSPAGGGALPSPERGARSAAGAGAGGPGVGAVWYPGYVLWGR